ncbi:MAG: hypothetical protein ACREWG_16770 [Gammaproteobacteria bacterium]
METPSVSRLVIGIALVAIVGAIAVVLQNNSPRARAADAFLLGTKVVQDVAGAACPEAVRMHIRDLVLPTPNETVSDGDRRIISIWKSESGPYRSIRCTYEMDKGVVALNIDGRFVVGSEATSGTGPVVTTGGGSPGMAGMKH